MRKLCLILFITSAHIIHAQLPAPIDIIQSPNAASLGIYGEIPVSPFTGVPEIEIPIYEFSVSGYKFPIKMSYHPAGVKLEQRSGWLGVGWTLMAGGCISRIANGMSDEFNSGTGIHQNTGYLYNKHELRYETWNTLGYLKDYLCQHYDGALEGGYDNDPDEFRFNFLDYRGSIYLNCDSIWKVKCDRNLKVEKVNIGEVPIYIGYVEQRQTHTKIITGFVLKDDEGVTYTFGNDPESIELSKKFYNQNAGHWSSSSWQLTKVSYPDGKCVNLIYERGDLTNQLWSGLQNYDTKFLTGDIIANDCLISIRSNKKRAMEGSLISPVFLKRIELPFGTIDFYSKNKTQLEYSTAYYNNSEKNPNLSKSYFYYLIYGISQGDKELTYPGCFETRLKSRGLESIHIKRNDGSTIKWVYFDFHPNGIKRLFLAKVSVMGSKGIRKSYKFDYNDFDRLPGYLSGKIDHWGYFNNVESDKGFNNPDTYFAMREPNDTVMCCGVLNKITYPTGGYTRFEFEPHRCGKILNDQRNGLIPDNNRLVGGVRIKKIINSEKGDGTDEITTKEYFYVNDYASTHGNSAQSSGVLACLPRYYYKSYNVNTFCAGCLNGYFNVICSRNSYITGGSNSLGSHIGYSEVTEKYPDGSFNVYKYTNFDTGAFDDQPESLYAGTLTENAKYSSREQDRGLLIEQSQYNDSFILTNKDMTTYSFGDKNDPSNYIRALYLKTTRICSVTLAEAATYKVYLDLPLKIKEIKNIYKGGGCFTTTMLTSYNKYRQPKDVTKILNNSDELKTDYTYLWETKIYYNQESDFVLTPIYGVNTSYLNAKTNVSSVINKVFYNYKRLENAIYVPVEEIKQPQGSSWMQEYTNCEYDKKGRIIFMESNKKEKTVFLWGYKGQHIVATIENATLSDVKNIIVNMDKFAEEDIPSFSKISKLREILTSARITSYAYLPLIGMISKTNPQGITEYYRYDNSGLLKYVTDNNGNVIRVMDYGFKNK